jgi:hypothetical protein
MAMSDIILCRTANHRAYKRGVFMVSAYLTRWTGRLRYTDPIDRNSKPAKSVQYRILVIPKK